MDHTSPTLLAQLAGPDRAAAWQRFVQLYTPLLFRWSERLGVPPSDRADLIQEVFLTLIRSLPQFSYARGNSFRGWLHTMFTNKWRDMRRKRVPVPIGGSGDFSEDAVADPTLVVDDAEYTTMLTDRAARLIRADFNEATWNAFWATTVQERPAAEVAASLGLSVNAVYLARARILQRLRKELAGLLE